jgi:GLPGLI family protein
MYWQTDGLKVRNIKSNHNYSIYLKIYKMKRFLITLSCLAFGLQLQAQSKKSGAIQFESTFDPAAMAAANGIKLNDQMLARMPKSSTTGYELLFNLTNASYMPVEELEDSNTQGGGNRFGGFGGFGNSNKEFYYSFADHKLSQVFDQNDTTYVMSDQLGKNEQMSFGPAAATPPVIEIVKSDETRKILGFNCSKVVIKKTSKRRILDEEREITEQTNLWYTTESGFDFSPNPALWTEGAVLAIEGKGTNVIAKSIEYRNVSNKDVNPPKKATVISPEAYKAKIDQMRKNMRNRQGGNGQVRSITIN